MHYILGWRLFGCRLNFFRKKAKNARGHLFKTNFELEKTNLHLKNSRGHFKMSDFFFQKAHFSITQVSLKGIFKFL